MKELGLVRDAQPLSNIGRAFIVNTSVVTLLPPSLTSHYLSSLKDANEVPYCSSPEIEAALVDDEGTIPLLWWLRKHICLLIATHLTHEPNRTAAISRLVDEISAQTDTPTVV